VQHSGPCGGIFHLCRILNNVAEPQFETEELKLDLEHLDPKTDYSEVASPMGSLLVVLNDSEIQIKPEGKPTRILRGGEVVWLKANSRTGVSNPSEKLSSYLQLYFRDSHKGAKP